MKEKTEAIKHDCNKPELAYSYLSCRLSLTPYHESLEEFTYIRAIADSLEEIIADSKDRDQIQLHIASIVENLRHLSNGGYDDYVTSVCKFGANKYGFNNFKAGMDWSRLVNACARHLIAFVTEGPIDAESGINHIGHMAANMYMLAYFVSANIGLNDLGFLEINKTVVDNE